MPSRKLRLGALVIVAALGLNACGETTLCINEKQVAERLAKLAADVQTASLKNKLPMDKLRELTIRVDTAGSHYSASKNANQYCKDMEEIRADYSL